MTESCNDRPCPYPNCGFNPAHSTACARIRRAYGPCPGPCDAPCYIIANQLTSKGQAQTGPAGS